LTKVVSQPKSAENESEENMKFKDKASNTAVLAKFHKNWNSIQFQFLTAKLE